MTGFEFGGKECRNLRVGNLNGEPMNHYNENDRFNEPPSVKKRGSERMRKQRRYTISVTSELEDDLEEAWREKYSQTPKSKMIRELLRIGLDSLEGSSNDENVQ